MRAAAILTSVAVLLAAGAAWGQDKPVREPDPDALVRASSVEPDWDEIARHPLGTLGNPVRAYLPAGQIAYLNRLICPGGGRPSALRVKAGDIGPYGNVTDIYRVSCGTGLRTDVVMDMYHPSTIETKPIPGFEIRGFQD